MKKSMSLIVVIIFSMSNGSLSGMNIYKNLSPALSEEDKTEITGFIILCSNMSVERLNDEYDPANNVSFDDFIKKENLSRVTLPQIKNYKSEVYEKFPAIKHDISYDTLAKLLFYKQAASHFKSAVAIEQQASGNLKEDLTKSVQQSRTGLYKGMFIGSILTLGFLGIAGLFYTYMPMPYPNK